MSLIVVEENVGRLVEPELIPFSRRGGSKAAASNFQRHRGQLRQTFYNFDAPGPWNSALESRIPPLKITCCSLRTTVPSFNVTNSGSTKRPTFSQQLCWLHLVKNKTMFKVKGMSQLKLCDSPITD